MKKLLCIISSLNAGGAETFLMKVCRMLPVEEYQFDFIVSEENGRYTQEVLDRGGKIFFVPARTKNLWGAIFSIASIVKKYEYDHVLKLGTDRSAVVDLIAAKLGGAKCLALRSCNALTDLSWKKKIIHEALLPFVNSVASKKFAPSIYAAEFMFGREQTKRNVYLVHNAVDLSVYCYDPAGRSKLRKELALDNKLVIGHVGRFSKQKNHQFLVSVFQEIMKLNNNAALLLVGEGELQNEVYQQARMMGIQDSIVFTGVRFDIPQLLSAMDVFVFPSLYEGMPNTVIEAQATGLPCVIADTITPEADITESVQFLSLEDSPAIWAAVALDAATKERRDTKQDFSNHGYNMAEVAPRFVSLIFEENSQ